MGVCEDAYAYPAAPNASVRTKITRMCRRSTARYCLKSMPAVWSVATLSPSSRPILLRQVAPAIEARVQAPLRAMPRRRRVARPGDARGAAARARTSKAVRRAVHCPEERGPWRRCACAERASPPRVRSAVMIVAAGYRAAAAAQRATRRCCAASATRGSSSPGAALGPGAVRRVRDASRRRRGAAEPPLERVRAPARRLRRGLPRPPGRGGAGDPRTRHAGRARRLRAPGVGLRPPLLGRAPARATAPASTSPTTRPASRASAPSRRSSATSPGSSRDRSSPTRAGSSRTCGPTSTRSAPRPTPALPRTGTRSCCARSPQGVRAGDPGALVVAGESSPTGENTRLRTSPQRFARLLGTRARPPDFDVYAHHPYPVGRQQGRRARAPCPATPAKRCGWPTWARCSAVFPDKPFYLSEFAYPTAGGKLFGVCVSEARQAAYLTESFASRPATRRCRC